jgi:hypothetical protein
VEEYMYSIGITTFRRRIDLVKNLIKSIRNYNASVPILIAINADLGETFDEEFRRDILKFCSQLDFLYPLVFPSFTGLSKMWNSLIINSPEDFILILNDDLKIDKRDFLTRIEEQIVTKSSDDIDTRRDLLLINGSWSHFLVSKKIMDDLGYFDERLIAFGEEDGDMVWRFINKYGHWPESLRVHGIRNEGEGYRIPAKNFEVFDAGHVFRPKFNREFASCKYEPSEHGIKGMFPQKMRQKIMDFQQYPYERFKEENYKNLFSFSQINFEEQERIIDTKPNVRLHYSNIYYFINFRFMKKIIRYIYRHLCTYAKVFKKFAP